MKWVLSDPKLSNFMLPHLVNDHFNMIVSWLSSWVYVVDSVTWAAALSETRQWRADADPIDWASLMNHWSATVTSEALWSFWTLTVYPWWDDTWWVSAVTAAAMIAEADDAAEALKADNLPSNESTDFSLEMVAEESIDGDEDAQLFLNHKPKFLPGFLNPKAQPKQ